MAERIQLRRSRGWRLPDGAVSVARPGRWGNPYVVGIDARTAAEAVELHRGWLAGQPGLVEQIRRELAGRDLACWCGLTDAAGRTLPCHAYTLLELANRPDGDDHG